MKTIFVIFTNVKKNDREIRASKKYCFNTESNVEVGDMFASSAYDTSMQVTDILDRHYLFYNSATGDLSNEKTSTKHYDIKELQVLAKENVVVATRI